MSSNTSTSAARRVTPGGFTLVEVMVAVAIGGMLAAMAISTYQQQQLKAKRGEAVMALGLLMNAQRAYHVTNGKFAASFTDLDFKLEGGNQLSTTSYKGKRYTFAMSQPWGSSSYYVLASGQLDPDTWADVVELCERQGYFGPPVNVIYDDTNNTYSPTINTVHP